MFARELVLNHTSPKFATVPISVDVCLCAPVRVHAQCSGALPDVREEFPVLKNRDGRLRIKKDPRGRDKMALQKTILARVTCLAGRVGLQHLNAVLRCTGALGVEWPQR